jgi:crossover junction endodeoxyribonuclease RuvC
MKEIRSQGVEFNVTIDPDQSIYVGIDQSWTGFGITALAPQQGVYVTSLYAIEGRGVRGLIDVLRDIDLAEAIYSADVVAIEGYSHAATNRAHMMGELGGIVRLLCYDNARTPESHYPLVVTPGQLKKYVTGKGNAGKNEMLLGVYKTFGVEFSDDNMADSYALACIAAGISKNAVQKKILSEIKTEKDK